MDLPATVGTSKVSFAMDTGASVNVLSEKAYRTLRRRSRGGRWPLRPHALNLVGVNKSPIQILGVVTLPVRLHRRAPVLRLDFYVASAFALAADGLIGISSMREQGLTIDPKASTILWEDLRLKAMEVPRSLLEEPTHKTHTHHIHSAVEAEVGVVLQASTPRPQQKRSLDMAKEWKSVKATVVGAYHIPPRTAQYVKVKVPDASEGCDVCLEGPSHVHNLNVEPTINTVDHEHGVVALVVNTTGHQIKLRQGTFLTKALVFDRKVEENPQELQRAYCSAVSSDLSTTDPASYQRTHLDSHVKVVDHPELKPPLLDLLSRHRDVIALPGEPLGSTECAEHYIKLKPGSSPVYVPAYRLPHSQRAVVDQQIREMLDQKVIQPSKSPWNSALFLVPKKDGSFRPVIDFRRVNLVTEDDRYPLPVLKDLLMSLGQGNTLFSSLDLLSGYWQVPMAPASRAVTAFSTPAGHFEWLRMPFGLKGAPLTFQRMINTLFGDMLGSEVHAYLDDLIICSKDANGHFQALEKVLLKLREAGLKAKLSKCEFLKSKIQFLGHMVDSEGIHTLPDKVSAVREFPRPENADHVRSFLGLAGYYRSFVKGFSTLAAPLNLLLKKEAPFHWHAQQEESFKVLKEALTNAPVLIFPDYSKPFIMCTDASQVGLGAVLMQTDNRGKNQPVAFASRTLNPAERNYSVTHLEALAIVWGLKKFRDIVYGYSITVYSDHAPVGDLFRGRNLNGRLARWKEIIEEYQPEFRYLPGRANVVADALSRYVPVAAVQEDGTTKDGVIPNFSLPELAAEQRNHPVWSKVIYALESGDETSLPQLHVPLTQFFLSEDGVLCRYKDYKRKPVTQLVIPDPFIPVVLRMVHDTPMAGHPGIERTLLAAREKYYWPTLKLDVEKYVRQCTPCAQCKGVVPGPAPIFEYPAPAKPWDVVSIDLLQLPLSRQGSRYLLVAVDHFSRFVVVAPLANKTAEAVAHALVANVFCQYSTPRVLLSDNGLEFRNTVLERICEEFGIKQTFTVAYHPSSNGLCERTNRKLLEGLRPILNGNTSTWEDWLPHVVGCVNGSVCESTGMTPHHILYGVEKRLPYDLLSKPQTPVYNVDDYVSCQRLVFKDIYQAVQENLTTSKRKMQQQQHKLATPVAVKAGDWVMTKCPERQSKLSPKFTGPRLVQRCVSGNKFELLDPYLGTTEIVHSDRLKLTDAHPEKFDSKGFNQHEHVHAKPSTTTNQMQSQNLHQHTYNLRPR